ncbi:hypothetical protein MPSEU_000782000 [Mayamaea pseudoterrestris]|nr:hypothetical protein MPSEU_000782000 [Mayamaea pseudoterrestris]
MERPKLPLHLADLLSEAGEVIIVEDNARIQAHSVTEEAYRRGLKTQRRRTRRSSICLFSNTREGFKPSDLMSTSHSLSLTSIVANAAPLITADDRSFQRARRLRECRWQSEPMTPPGLMQRNVVLKARSPPKADVPVSVPIRRPSRSIEAAANAIMTAVMDDLSLFVEDACVSKDECEDSEELCCVPLRIDGDIAIESAVETSHVERAIISEAPQTNHVRRRRTTRSQRLRQAFKGIKIGQRSLDEDEDQTSTTFDMASTELSTETL